MKKILFVIILLTIHFAVFAQSLSDIQNVKVDNLSDAQIEQLMKRAEAQGLNEQQMFSMAQERGMPAGEVAKLRQRIASLRSGGGTTQQQTQERGSQLRQVGGMVNQNDIFDSLRRSDPYFDLTPTQKKIFGYTLFHNRNLNFNPSLNVPTPQGYTLGAGDQLLIDVYGASQQAYDVVVNPDGRIFIPNVGPIQVGGSTVSAATARIRSSLSRIYAGLEGGNPNTFLDIRLGNIRTVSISMVGELNRPGTYTLPSFASPFNALFAAGGPNENGSFRHIQIYRANKLLEEIDVYDFLIKGEFTSSVVLKDNDVIIVPPVRNRVELTGPVRREGFFELKQNETVDHLLKFSGGFSSDAYKERITVTRKTLTEMKVEDVDSKMYASFFLQDGDLIRVGKILERYENRVQVSGAVQRPGTFALTIGMSVKDLLEKSGGLREDAFVNRATLYRTKSDFSLEIIPINVKGILDGSFEDIILKREDVVNIPSIYELREEYYIKISGEVNRPGAFAFGDGMTVEDLILKAGGFKEAATSSKIEIARRVSDNLTGKIAEIILLDIDKDLKINPGDSKFLLKPFDHVMIRRIPGFQREQLVRVEGEAFFPGEFAIAHANERISDLVRRAGGLNKFAYSKGATLIRRNEFYKEVEEEEKKLELLKLLKESTIRDSLNWSDAEKSLFKQIDRRILLNEELKKNKKDDLDAVEFRLQSIKELGDTTEGIGEIKVKDTELIGINLQEILRNPYGPDDLLLKEGDVLSIPRELQTVRMRGEVLYPTTTRYREFSTFKSYISRAGGFSEKARRSRSYVVYANGDVKRTKKVIFVNFYPSVEPGAEIIVPAKPEREGMNAQAWIGLSTGLATLVLLIGQILP